MKSSTLLVSLLTLGTAGVGVGGYLVFTQGQTIANINNVVQPSISQVKNQIVSNKENLEANEIQSPKISATKSEASKSYYLDWSEKHGLLAKWWNSW